MVLHTHTIDPDTFYIPGSPNHLATPPSQLQMVDTLEIPASVDMPDADSAHFWFTEVTEGSDMELNVSMAYIEPVLDHVTPTLSLPGSSHSSILTQRDSDEVHSPPGSPQNVPQRTIRLSLPSCIHPVFPGCTPSTPASSQQAPQVSPELWPGAAE